MKLVPDFLYYGEPPEWVHYLGLTTAGAREFSSCNTRSSDRLGLAPDLSINAICPSPTPPGSPPTDAMPLSRWAKSLMLAQSLISLITVILVAARAINGLPSS